MKILYGVVGEGMGHATRSHCILNHLKKDHELQIVAPGKAYRYLNRYFPNVKKIEGYEFEIDENTVDYKKTIGSILRSGPKKGGKNLVNLIKTSMKYKPDVVLSDFDSFSFVFGKAHDIPIISIDNMQIINRCNTELETKHLNEFLMAKTIVHGKLPGCYHYLITTFFFPEVIKQRTSLYPPILRDEILKAKAKDGKSVLIYQTAGKGGKFISSLKGVNENFIVYGFNESKKEGNLTFKKTSKVGFIRDLSHSKAVIANSGFSLIGETLYFKKPYFAVPLRGQYEQILNASYLKKLGYGDFNPEPAVKDIEYFLDNLDDHRSKLAGFEHDRNRGIMTKLDQLLGEIEVRSEQPGAA